MKGLSKFHFCNKEIPVTKRINSMLFFQKCLPKKVTFFMLLFFCTCKLALAQISVVVSTIVSPPVSPDLKQNFLLGKIRAGFTSIDTAASFNAYIFRED